MSKHDRFDTTIRIPVVTDLVTPGDAEVIRRAHERNPRALGASYEHTLKVRMADIHSATGQDEYGKLGRAHAIRSESNKRPTQSSNRDVLPENYDFTTCELPIKVVQE